MDYYTFYAATYNFVRLKMNKNETSVLRHVSKKATMGCVCGCIDSLQLVLTTLEFKVVI